MPAEYHRGQPVTRNPIRQDTTNVPVCQERNLRVGAPSPRTRHFGCGNHWSRLRMNPSTGLQPVAR